MFLWIPLPVSRQTKYRMPSGHQTVHPHFRQESACNVQNLLHVIVHNGGKLCMSRDAYANGYFPKSFY